MNPEHWLDAADQLVNEARSGAPRQVNLRCAVSMVYYGLFHWLANSVADALAGATRPRDHGWVRVYRGVYDPAARFSKRDAVAFIASANRMLLDLDETTPAEKRALAIHVLFKERPGSL